MCKIVVVINYMLLSPFSLKDFMTLLKKSLSSSLQPIRFHLYCECVIFTSVFLVNLLHNLQVVHFDLVPNHYGYQMDYVFLVQTRFSICEEYIL